MWHSTNLDTVGQRPALLAEGAGGGVWIFLFIIVSLFFLPLSGRRPHIDID